MSKYQHARKPMLENKYTFQTSPWSLLTRLYIGEQIWSTGDLLQLMSLVIKQVVHLSKDPSGDKQLMFINQAIIAWSFK